MLGKLIGKSTSRAAIHKATHVPAANTDAVVTIAGVAGKQHMILGLQWSYSTSQQEVVSSSLMELPQLSILISLEQAWRL